MYSSRSKQFSRLLHTHTDTHTYRHRHTGIQTQTQTDIQTHRYKQTHTNHILHKWCAIRNYIYSNKYAKPIRSCADSSLSSFLVLSELSSGWQIMMEFLMKTEVALFRLSGMRVVKLQNSQSNRVRCLWSSLSSRRLCSTLCRV